MDILKNPQMMQQFVLFGVLIFAMYFLILRPQKKKEKEITNMRNSIKAGDEIITIGGIYGRVLKVKEESLMLQIGSDKVKIEITKWAVSKVVNPADETKSKKVSREEEASSKKKLPKRLGAEIVEAAEEEKEEVAEIAKALGDEESK